MANGKCSLAGGGKGFLIHMSPLSTLPLPSAMSDVQPALSCVCLPYRPLTYGSPRDMGRNCVTWMNEPASPLGSCWLWEWSLFCRDFGFSHANMRLGKGPLASSYQIGNPGVCDSPFPHHFAQHKLWTHRCCINIWWIEHWHPFLCTLFLFCILMGSLNQNTLPKPKEKKMANYTDSRTDYSYIHITGTSNPPTQSRCCGNKRDQWVWVTGRIAGCKPTWKLWSWNLQNPLAVNNLFMNEKKKIYLQEKDDQEKG